MILLKGNSTSLDVHSQNAAIAKTMKRSGPVTGEKFSSECNTIQHRTVPIVFAGIHSPDVVYWREETKSNSIQ